MKDNLQDISENGITLKQTRAIACLLTCKTMGEAAKGSKISERTLYNWLNNTNFRAALREAEKQIFDVSTRRLIAGQGQALDALMSLIDRAKNESTKRQASVDWLNLLLRYRDLNELEERITEIEKKVFYEQTIKD